MHVRGLSANCAKDLKIHRKILWINLWTYRERGGECAFEGASQNSLSLERIARKTSPDVTNNWVAGSRILSKFRKRSDSKIVKDDIYLLVNQTNVRENEWWINTNRSSSKRHSKLVNKDAPNEYMNINERQPRTVVENLLRISKNRLGGRACFPPRRTTCLTRKLSRDVHSSDPTPGPLSLGKGSFFLSIMCE